MEDKEIDIDIDLNSKKKSNINSTSNSITDPIDSEINLNKDLNENTNTDLLTNSEIIKMTTRKNTTSSQNPITNSITNTNVQTITNKNSFHTLNPLPSLTKSSDSEELKSKLFDLITNGDFPSLQKLILDLELEFWLIKENDGSTSLVKSTFLNMTEISIFLIEEAKRNLQFKDNKLFIDFINKKGDNGFNALHYAAFRGNIKILEKLIENGADISIKNNSGLNVMHMAAQGDQPNVLVFFKEKFDLKISCLDSVMSTPLHWASYMGAESSVDYLMSWNADINARDKDGFTPLHLAVMTEKIRIIKKLIKLGAYIHAEDYKNRKPIDIAICRNNSQIIEVLQENINFFSCNLNKFKSQDSFTFPTTFFLYFIFIELISSFIILPHLNSVYKYELSTSLTVALFIFYLKLFFSDPGFKNNKINKTLLKLSLDGEVLNNICPWCVLYMKSSSKHCYHCNRCVDNFDHHCIWIKNCVGNKNFNVFFLFLIILCCKIAINVFFSFQGKKEYGEGNN